MSRLDPPARYATLDPDARAARTRLWDDTITRLTETGRVFTADPALIDVYVEARAGHEDASGILARTHVLITRGGQAVENPALATQRRCADQIARTGKALGLDKSAALQVSGRLPSLSSTTGSTPGTPAARWCDRHQRRECTHHRRRCGHPKGVPPPPDGCCHERAVIGTDTCRHHAGMALPALRAKAAKAQLTGAYGGPPAQISPAEALLAEVRRSAGIVAGLQRLVGQLEAETADTGSDQLIPGQDHLNQSITGQASSLWGGVSRVVTRDGQVAEVTAEAGPHVVLQAYERERAHLARVAKAAVDAGAQQAAVDLARLLGAEATRLIDSILAGLELNERQRDVLVPQVVPAALRAWAG